MEEKKNSVLRVLTDISEAKSLSNEEGSLRSNKEIPDSPPSLDDLRILQKTKQLLHKKNQLHPLFANHPYRFAGFQVPRAASSRPKPKDLSQRIVSAKLLQIKELRNQLTLSQHQLNEVTSENRFLKTLQKRQEAALRKYEGHEARLPQLIQAHSEELRVLNTKLKQARHTNQRLVEKLKTAENQLTNLQQQHYHLMALSRDQQLGEREALAEQVRDLQASLSDKTTTVQLLTRKVDLERKNYKHELGIEKSKRSDVERKLSLAMQTIENLKDQIEVKERCMNAIVPSRYVRGPSQPSLNSSRLAHSQIPRKQNTVHPHMDTAINVDNMPRRSSTDQTGDEIDIVESRNSKTTSDSSRTLSGTTLPKIKPQLSSRTLRKQFKNVYKERSSINNDSPDYSSSFASVDVSLKDLRKHSDSEAEQLIQSKRQISLNSQTNSSRNRKYSVDSGVINKSSGKVTQRTDQSRMSSSKTRRNSISVCPSARAEQVEQYLQQDSLNVKEEVHKTVKEELRELEVKLLHEASFLEKSRIKKTSDSEAEEPIKELNKDVEKTATDDSEDESNQSNHDNLDDDAWSKIHERVKAESDAAEAKLEGYYNSLEKSELNLEETENYIALEQEQKERLLKALKDIDREAGGVSSASSIEEPELLVNPQPIRRKSDGSNYSFSKNIENLHRGRPVHNKVKVPVIEKMKREEKEYLLDIENVKKNKADFMKELFGKLDIGLQNEKFLNSKIPNETEQLIQLNRSFD